MAIRVTCDSCSRTLDVRDELAGKRGKCPQCGAAVIVPALEAAAPPPEPSSPKPAPPRQRPPAAPRAAPPTPPPAPVPPAPVLPAVGASPLASASVASRVKKSGGVPLWAWLTAAFVCGGGLVGLGVYAMVATVDTKPVAAAPPVKSRTGVGRPNASQPNASQPNSATQANNSATQASNVNRQPSRAAAPESSNEPGAGAFTFSANVAKNVNEVKLAIVKFEIPSGDGAGMTTGTGFLINEKGWVATNWHVIEDATTAARARMSNGTTCALAGIVAKSPEHDLAIVKLAERPVQLTVLNIAFDDEPELAADVLAFGHPMNEDFVVRKGAISTVLTTGDLIGEAGHSHLVETIKAPRSLVWIRHDAGILPGNSGGPLFLADGRVLGVNTFINAITHSGYASHIRYLRELAARSNDVVQPLPDRQAAALVETEPPPFAAGELTVSADRMKELYDAAAAVSFKPTTADEYLPFAELARQMTYARYLQLGKQKTARGEVEQRSQYANDLFGHMRAFDFSPKHVQALNAQATAAMEKPRGGVVFLGVVTGSGPGVLLVSVESTEQLVCVPSSTAANANFGTRVLVVGVVGPQVQTVTDAQRKPHRIPVLLSHHVGELTTPTGD